jgi:hypothetical protein
MPLNKRLHSVAGATCVGAACISTVSAFSGAAVFSRSILAKAAGESPGMASAVVAITANPAANRMKLASGAARRAMFNIVVSPL